MKSIRKRLTYANVMSSIAVFLVLGGASAFAAGQLGKNSVGAKQLKKNAVTAAKIKKNSVTAAKIKKKAVTAAKIKNGAVTTGKIKKGAVTGTQVAAGSLTGTNINVATLGTVPSATTAASAGTAKVADSANALANRTPFSVFVGNGIHSIATIGPFTVKGNCEINQGGQDVSELQLYTSVSGASMDDNSGDEFASFSPEDNPAELLSEEEATGEPAIEAGYGEFVAVGPEGTVISLDNQAVGSNIGGHPGQCFFSGILEKLN